MIETASTFGRAAVIVRGHSDPTRTLADFVKGGMAKGILKRNGTAPNYNYELDGKPFDLAKTDEVLKAIESGLFDGVTPHPRENAQAAEALSLERAAAVKQALLEFAKSKGANLDESQILPVGIREPRIARPKDIEEAKQNTRVEFRVVRVAAEALKQSDFDF